MLQRHRPLHCADHIDVPLLYTTGDQSLQGEKEKCLKKTKTQLICNLYHCLSNSSLKFSVSTDVSVVYPPDPLAELHSIWYCGAKENDTDVIRKHNQNLLPHNPSLRKTKEKENSYS